MLENSSNQAVEQPSKAAVSTSQMSANAKSINGAYGKTIGSAQSCDGTQSVDGVPAAKGSPLDGPLLEAEFCAVDAAQEDARRFAWIFAQAAIGMALVTPEGCFLEVNQAFCILTGYSPRN